MNNPKVDFVNCCDMDDPSIVHCCDIGIDLLADSPAREFNNVKVVDTLDRSDVLTDTVTNPLNPDTVHLKLVSHISRRVDISLSKTVQMISVQMQNGWGPREMVWCQNETNLDVVG